MSVRFLFVFDLLFNLFRIALWPSVGKELSPCAFHLCCFYFSAVLKVDVFFPFGGQDVEFDCIGSWYCHYFYLLCFRTSFMTQKLHVRYSAAATSLEHIRAQGHNKSSYLIELISVFLEHDRFCSTTHSFPEPLHSLLQHDNVAISRTHELIVTELQNLTDCCSTATLLFQEHMNSLLQSCKILLTVAALQTLFQGRCFQCCSRANSCSEPFQSPIHSLLQPATPFGPRQANLVLIAYASSEGSGEPAHSRSLARTSAARSESTWQRHWSEVIKTELMYSRKCSSASTIYKIMGSSVETNIQSLPWVHVLQKRNCSVAIMSSWARTRCLDAIMNPLAFRKKLLYWNNEFTMVMVLMLSKQCEHLVGDKRAVCLAFFL